MSKLLFAVFFALLSCSNTIDTAKIKEGDMIFQISKSTQSKAIQLATHSKYSHMGIIFKNGTEYYVLEAVQPVKYTPLKEWIKRGEKYHYVVKRLKDSERILNEDNLRKMREIGEKFKGKNYDLYFEWSDDKIYCSELVWKMYQRAIGMEIGQLQRIKDFDLNNPAVKKKLKERYGDNIPFNELAISPASMFDSNELKTIIEN